MASRTLIVSASVVALAGALVVVNALMSKAPACPEHVVRSGAHREPRNAAGQIRYCWPGMTRCVCDSDNDCYADEGYVACTPLPKPVADAGVRVDVPRVDVAVPRDLGSARDVVAAVDVRPAVDTGPVAPPAGAPLAFSGAEGWGAVATGGRGGRVIVVTNLNTSGPGSLQAALTEQGRRVIVFRVSGVINAPISIPYGDVTIAGQTSPGGITVRGIDTTEAPYCDSSISCAATARKVDNLVIRFIRSRPAGGSFPDALRLRYVRRAIVDHCSMGAAADESVEISYSNNITIQNSILSETIGDHAEYGGMLVNYTNPSGGYALDNLTIIRNAWVRIQGRFPEFSRESVGAAGTTMRVELSSNYYHDRRFHSNFEATDVSGDDQGRAIHYLANVVGNYSRVGPTFSYGQTYLRVKAPGTTAFLDGNVISRFPTLDSWAQNYCCNDASLTNHGTRPTWARTTRHPFPVVTIIPAASLRAYAVSSIGALPRDPMDTRLLSFVAANTIDPRPINQGAGDALRPIANPPAPPIDGDNDGLADEWERANGCNPTIDDHNAPRGAVTAMDLYLDAVAADRLAGR